MCIRFIYVACLLLSIAGQYSIVRMYHVLLIHLPFEGHVDDCEKKKTALNIYYRFGQETKFPSLLSGNLEVRLWVIWCMYV